jgi:hypothetical protein
LDICAFGSVSRELQEEVAASVSECYARLDVLLPSVVALRFFDTVKRQQVEHERERRMLGVVSGGGDPLPVGHSAWGDMPRITVCVERLEPLPGLLRQGMVHVAAAHAVLHGSADYYLFRIPAAIVREGQETGIGSVLLQQFLYQVATAVKGNGAVRLLVSHGFIADQVALAMHQLEVTADDRLAWQLARSAGLATGAGGLPCPGAVPDGATSAFAQRPATAGVCSSLGGSHAWVDGPFAIGRAQAIAWSQRSHRRRPER